MISQFGSLWKMFIRPTRQEYTISDLGQETQVYGQYKSKRTDQVIVNKKNLRLQCSLFEPIQINQGQNDQSNSKFNCVIYCHCNSGSRVEALRLLPNLISRGIGLFCFDFSGSGLSDGEYVTLGINESQDLDCIVNYLSECGKINNIVLWGRSMGAVTSMMFLSKKQSQRIKGVIFDSGFANLNFLALDFARQKTGMPNLVLDLAISQVRDQVKERVPIDIQKIDLTKFITNIYIPCYFICSKEDTFVKCEHAEQLYARYNGQKWLEYVGGNHNAQRTNEIIDKLSKWVDEQILNKDQQNTQQQQQQQNNTQTNQARRGTMTTVIDLTDNKQASRKTSGATNKMLNSTSSTVVKQSVTQSPQNPRGSLNIDRSVSPIKSQGESIITNKPNMQQSLDINKVQFSQQQQQVMQNRPKHATQIINLQTQIDSLGQQQQAFQQQQQQQKQMEYNQIIQQVKQEKERQQQEMISSQTRIPTEETSSRNDNNEIINNNNISGKNNTSQNAYSFLSNINDDISSNDRVISTPQRNTDGTFRDYEESPRSRAANNRRQDSQPYIQTQKSTGNLFNVHQQQIGGEGNDNYEIEYQNGDFPSRRNANQNFNSFQVPFNASQDGESPFQTNNSHKRASVQNLTPLSVNKLSSKNDFSKENSLAGTPQFKPDKKSMFGISTITIDTNRQQVDLSPVLRTDGKIEDNPNYQGLNYQSPYGNPQRTRNPSQFSIQSMQQNQITTSLNNNNQNEGQNNQKVFDFNNQDLTTTPPKRADKQGFAQTEISTQQNQQSQQPPKQQQQQTIYQVTISQKNNSTNNLQRSPQHIQIQDLISSVPSSQITQKDDENKNNRNSSNSINSAQRQQRSSTCNGEIPQSNQIQLQHQYSQQQSSQLFGLQQNNEQQQNPQPNQIGYQQVQQQSSQQQNKNNQQNIQFQNQQNHPNPFYQAHQNFNNQNNQNQHNHHPHQHHHPPPQRHTLATTRDKIHGQSYNNGIASSINEFLQNNNQHVSMKLKTAGNEPYTPKQLKTNHPSTTTGSSYSQVNQNQNFLQLQQPFFSSYTGPISPSNPQQQQQKSGNPLTVQIQKGIQQEQITNPNSPARLNTQNVQQQYIRQRGANGSIDASSHLAGSEPSQNSGQNQMSNFNQGHKSSGEARLQLSPEKQRAEQYQFQQQGAPVKSILQGNYSANDKNITSNQYGLQQNVNMIIGQQNPHSHLQSEKKTGFTHVPITSISISSSSNNNINSTNKTEIPTNISENISNQPPNQISPINISNVANNPLTSTNMNSSNNVMQYTNSETTMSRKSTETSNYSSTAGDINFIKQFPIQNNNMQQQYGIDFTSNQGSSSGRKYSENITQTNTNFNLYHNMPQQQTSALQYTQQANSKNLSITPPQSIEELTKGLASHNIGQTINQPSSTKNTTFSLPNKLFSTYDNAYTYKQDVFENKRNSKNIIDFSESNQFAFATQHQPTLAHNQSATPKNSNAYRIDALLKDSASQYKLQQSQQSQAYQRMSNNK